MRNKYTLLALSLLMLFGISCESFEECLRDCKNDGRSEVTCKVECSDDCDPPDCPEGP